MDRRVKWTRAHPEYYFQYRHSFRGFFMKLWHGMKDRCTLKSHKHRYYHGLPYMDREAYSKFLKETINVRKKLHAKWVKSGYQIKLTPTIDRINVERGYIPDNCQWLSHAENSIKRRIKILKGGTK